MIRRARRVLTLMLALCAALAAAGVSADIAGAATSCNPSINPAGTPAPGTVVAPGLRVISTQWGQGNCPNAFFVSARTADGTIWAVDYANHIWKSTDDLRTLTLTYTATAYSQVEEVMPLASGTVLISVLDANGNRHILRSTDSTGTSFASTPVLDLPAGASLHDSQSWVQMGSAVYLAQYQGGPPVNLWRSADDGRTFQSVWVGNDLREIHAVQVDPYQSGRLWITTDNENNPSVDRFGYSDDGGQTFTWVSQQVYPQSRALSLMFDSNAVYWGCDCPEVPGALYRWDRQTKQISTLMSNLNGAFLTSVAYNGQFAQFTDVEPSSGGYAGDQFIHVLTNGAGGSSSWSLTRTPWSRDQTNLSKYANPQGSTAPDSQGRFWVGYYDLAGSPNLEANIEFQFDPTATYNGVKAAFTAAPNPFQISQPVSFDGTGSSSPAGSLSYLWRFGDGATATGSTASHPYSSGGPTSASLQVNDAKNDVSLTTQTLAATAQAPTVETGGAPAAGTAATLYGTVSANGAATTAHFEYGTTSSYGSQTSDQAVPAGAISQTLNAALTGLQPNTTYHYRLDATNGAGTSRGIDRVFTTAQVATSATTGNASNVQGHGATLNGTVNPNGLATTVRFDYGTTTSYGSSTASQDVGNGTSASPVSAAATGLQGNTLYHFRIVATNEAGTYYGSDQTFTTLPPPPVPTTGPTTFVTSTGATLNASVNPSGGDTLVHFEYGLTSSYGSQTSDQDIGSGTTAAAVTAAISGLQPNTTYHYRVDATNSNGPASGADATFTTGGGPPVLTTAGPSGVSSTSATLNGTVDPQGLTTTTYFQYGSSTSYGSQTTTQTLPGNLVPNPGFDSGSTSGWALGGSVTPTTFQAQTGWASTGGYSGRFTTGTIPTNGYSEENSVPYMKGITAGTQYNVSTDLNVLSLTSGQRVVLYVSWRDSAGNGISKVQVQATKVTGLQTLSGLLTAPANATQAQIDMTVENAGVADFYFDNVKLLATGSGLPAAVTAQLTGLSPASTYHYRLVATNGQGTTFGPDQTLTTTAAPTATTLAASQITYNGATLNASVTPNGDNTSAYFQYGPDTLYGTSTPAQNAGNGYSAQAISAAISGLAPNSVYHYRVVATNGVGTTYGADQVLTTTTVPDNVAPTSTATAPSISTSNNLSISWTASDNAGGSGLAEVDLYAKAPGDSGFNKVASDTSGNATGSFSYNGSAGDGSYSFYTVATDAAGNSEPAPSSPDATTVVDTTAPTSTAGAQAASNSSSLNVTYTASDNASGLAEVDLYAKAPGDPGFTKVAADTSGNATGSFSYNAAAGDGSYSFYTVATDAAGNAEQAPSSPDATTVVDTTAPTSTATAPARSTSTAFNVSYTASDNVGGSGLARVDLYAQTPGQPAYSLVASDSSGHGNGSFAYTANAGAGTYSFYTIAWDNAGNTQPTPSNPQATTVVQVTTSVDVAAPATDGTGTPINANSISATLAGASAGAGGTISFEVFGPQANAPTSCTSGGTVVGTAGVNGNGTYNPSTGFTPSSVGTYWWYATYTGDANNLASASTCGDGMASTTVAATTNTSIAAPATGSPGTAIAAGSISATLSGAASGAGGTITFKVFGPQSTAPSSCSSGGTTVGTASVNGNGSYNPSSGYTPSSAGTYWWYASYSGDGNNLPSASACDGGMTTTAVQATTATTASGPANGTTGSAIAGSAISSSLSGAAVGAGGTITFKVFGPQATAPSTCSTGGTTVGTAAVSGNGSYHPSAGSTPASAGTYWWYASYGGDSTDLASSSTCGAGMSSTVVVNSTSITTTAPSAGISGAAIGTAAISATLSGGTNSAGGTITFKVVGPQSSAPSGCPTGGTTIDTIPAGGNGRYHPTVGFTPSSAGTYWWYVSYSGDSKNAGSSSACDGTMARTYVYSATSVASVADTSGASSTTSTFTVRPNTTYLLLVYRNSVNGDGINSVSSTGFTPGLNFSSLAAQSFFKVDYQSVYSVTTGAGANGTGSITVSFKKALGVGQVTILDVIALGGNNTGTPIVTTNERLTFGNVASATANMPNAPASGDAGLVFLVGQQDLGSAPPTASPAMTNAFYSHQPGGSAGLYMAAPSQQQEAIPVGAGTSWGTIALEVAHG